MSPTCAECQQLRADKARLLAALKRLLEESETGPDDSESCMEAEDAAREAIWAAEGRAAEGRATQMVDCALTNDADPNDQESLGPYPDTAEGIRDAALAALTRLGWSLTTSTIEGRAES